MFWSKGLRRGRAVSVRTRITLSYAGAFAVFAVILFLWEDAVIMRWLSSRRDDELMASARQYEALYLEFGLRTVADEFRRQAEAEGIENVFLRFLSPNRRVLAESDLSAWEGLDLSALGRTALDPGQARFHDITDAANSPRLRLAEIRLADGNYLLIGSSVHADSALLARFRLVFVWVCVGMLGFATLLGWLLTGRAMAGVSQVRKAAEAISEKDLSIRVSPDYGGREIAELAHSFNHMLDRVGVAVAAIQTITDNIAHDLKSPLTRMRGAAESIIADADRNDTDRSLAAMVIENCDDLVQMIDTMLEIAEVDAGASRLQAATVDMTALVHEAHDLFTPVAEDKTIDFRLDLHAAAQVVQGDPARLQRAVANLVDNALKYTPAGGRVTLSVAGDGQSVRVSVEDTGPGIPEAHVERIFDRFCRLDSSRATPGHGLGLALVQAVARAHGGSVSVSSEPGKGSRFTLVLPAAASERVR